MRSIGTPAELERRRHLAVQRVAEGYPAEEVADFLGVDPRSVRRWLASFCDGALAARPAPGRPPKLSSTQEKLVSRWLQHSPTDFGFANELWTGPRLARLIEQEWRVHFHPRYLAAWLRARDYSPQRPRRIPRERDRQAIARWRVQDWPRIKAEARRLGAHLALIDESGLLLGPLLRRTWAPVGQTPELLQRSRHRDKVSVAAAVWLPPGRGGRLGLSFWTLENGYFNNVAVAAFLGELLGELGSPLVVVWDGGSVHKGDPIRELVGQSAGRLVLERLPPYGPELMPVEYLWAWLKDDRLCNFAPYSVRELNEAASAELKAAQKDQRRLRGFFHACSLPLPRTLLT